VKDEGSLFGTIFGRKKAIGCSEGIVIIGYSILTSDRARESLLECSNPSAEIIVLCGSKNGDARMRVEGSNTKFWC